MTAGRYEVTTDRSRIPAQQVIEYLATSVPWGKWRTRDQLTAALANSWRLGAAIENSSGQVVAFARVISDGVGLAYVADVYTVPEHRGQGLAMGVLEALIEQEPGRKFRWMLHTDSAHGLYAKLGFESPDDTYMERRRPPGQ